MSKKFDKYLASQQKLAEFGALNNKLAESLSAIGLFYQHPIFDIQKTITSPTFLKYERASQVIENMAKLGSIAALSPPYETLVNSNLQQQTKLIQERLAFLAPDFGIMSVHKNYVSIPESLIPDDFIYEEIADNSTDDSDEVTKTAVPVKRLSFADTLTLIDILIGILIFVITSIQSNQDSLQNQKNHDERIAIEVETNRIQEEQNQILQSQVEALEKQAEYLLAIYDKIEEAGSVSPESDSTFLGTDLTPLNPASPSQCADSCQTVEADEPDDFDTPRKAD